MLTFRKIEMVEAVIKHGSITDAARAIGISQPALTQGIKSIETELNVTLFTRSARGLLPTAFAEPFARYAAHIRSEILAAKRDLRDGNRDKGNVLRVQCGPRTQIMWVDSAIALLAERRPDLYIALTVSNTSLTENIQNERVEISILPSDIFPKNSGFTIEPIGSVTNRFICRADHPLAQIKNPTLEQIRNYPLVSNSIAPRHLAQFGNELGRLGTFDEATNQFVPAIVASSIAFTLECLQNGDGIGMLPPELFGQEFEDGRLVALGEGNCRLVDLPTAIVCNKELANNVDVRNFIDCVREIALERTSFFQI